MNQKYFGAELKRTMLENETNYKPKRQTSVVLKYHKKNACIQTWKTANLDMIVCSIIFNGFDRAINYIILPEQRMRCKQQKAINSTEQRFAIYFK